MRTRTILFLVTAAMALVLAGCDSGSDGSGGATTAAGDLTGDAYAVVGAEDVYASIEDATMLQAMHMDPVMPGDGTFHRHRRHPGHPGSHVGVILMQLDLTEEQAMEIRAILAQHREDVQPILEQLRLVNQPIVERANQERAQIMQQLRNDEITPEEARRLMNRLNERTREAIRNNPDNVPYLMQLCEAKRDLFDAIRAVLDETQQALWDDWVAGLPGPCLGD
jgi:hypothetical protein